MLLEGPDGPGNGGGESRGPLLRNVSAIMMVLAVVAIFFRLLARRISRTPILLDDVLIISALPFTLATASEVIVGVTYHGFGQHFDLAKPEHVMYDLINCLRGLYVFTICYVIALNLIKFSFLAFIYRLFHVPRMKLPILITAVMIGLSSTASLLTCIFSCQPISGFWDIQVRSNCINPQKFYSEDSIPAIVTDLMILLLPMPMIWKLRINRSQKWGLSGIFLIGVFVVICHTVRFVNLLQTTESLDVTWELSFPALWSIISLHVGICCACLPSIWSLFRLYFEQKKSKTSTTFESPHRTLGGSKIHKSTAAAISDTLRSFQKATWPGRKLQISMPTLSRNTPTNPKKPSNTSNASARFWPGSQTQLSLTKPPPRITSSLRNSSPTSAAYPLFCPRSNAQLPPRSPHPPPPPPKDHTSPTLYSYHIYPQRVVIKNYIHGHMVPLSKFNELKEPDPEPAREVVLKGDVAVGSGFGREKGEKASVGDKSEGIYGEGKREGGRGGGRKSRPVIEVYELSC